jgi:hypothetical protein
VDGLKLTDTQEAELHRLLGFYNREADRCGKALAFLAACVMAGAELETALLLTVNVYPDEAVATGKLPRKKKSIKPLLEWNLGELLRVAKAAGWLPSALIYGEDEWSSRKAKVGDYAEVLREFRNLTHPARYMEDHYRKRVTKKHLGLVFDTINAARDWLYARIEKSLLERMKAEGWTPTKEKRAAPRKQRRLRDRVDAA